jgi:hypothetical protein
MKSRTVNTLSLISALLLACTVSLWVWSFWSNPGKNYLSLSNSFHIGSNHGRVDFFNEKSGPYHGSIISLCLTTKFGEDVFSERREFGDALGVYYRYFRWADSGAVLWTLSVSLAYPLVVLAVLPVIWCWLWWRARRLLPACQQVSGPRQDMAVAIRLYWWMGVLGTVYSVLVLIGVCLAAVARAEFPSVVDVAPMLTFLPLAGAFGASVYVSRRLTTRPEGMLPCARMVGIILATAMFPILTIPGIICVRRATRSFAPYCDSVRPDARNHVVCGPSPGEELL